MTLSVGRPEGRAEAPGWELLLLRSWGGLGSESAQPCCGTQGVGGGGAVSLVCGSKACGFGSAALEPKRTWPSWLYRRLPGVRACFSEVLLATLSSPQRAAKCS